MLITDLLAGVKTFDLVLKDSDVTYLELRDDSNNTTETYDVTDVFEDEYYYSVEIDILDDLTEGKFYDFKLYSSMDELIYYDRVFATDQQTNNYSINKDSNGDSKYIPHVSTNEYITYG
jgi:hypothetical protein